MSKKRLYLLTFCLFFTHLFTQAQEEKINKEDWTRIDLTDVLDSVEVGENVLYVDETWKPISSIEYIEQYRFVKHEKSLYQQGDQYAVKLDPLTDPLKLKMFTENSERFTQVYELNKKPVPHFELTTIEGKMFTPEELKGKVVVLSFWFIGCPPCIREMPELNEIVDKYEGNEEVIFLSYSLDEADNLKAFLKKKTFKFHIGDKHNDMSAFSVRGYPTNFIIDQHGVVDLIIGGSQVKGVVKQVIEEKLEELLTK